MNVHEDEFQLRLAQLRIQKGVSAREMSLALGQNSGYINTIENGKALPSMSVFLYMCDYLGVTPCEFFDTETANPEKLRSLVGELKRLDSDQLDAIATLVRGLLR